MTPAWKRPAFWAWLCLAGIPVDLLAWARGWTLVDPVYLGLSLLWWPVDTLGRLMALQALLGGQAPAWRRFPAALSAEVRLSLWMTCVLLAGLVPAFFVMSWKGFQSRPWLALELGLGLLGLVPGLLYSLHRLLAPILVLEGADAADALTGSAQRLRGRMGPFLKAWLPWTLAGLALEAAGWALPDPWGLALTPLATAVELNALLRGASAL